MEPNKPEAKPASRDSETTKETQVVVSSARKTRKRIKIIMFIVLLIVILLGISWLVVIKTQDKPVACTENIIAVARIGFKGGDIDAQHKLLKKIKARPGYDKDINCAYINSAIYINSHDYKDAVIWVKRLDKMRHDGQKLNSSLIESWGDLKYMHTRLDELKQSITEIRNNMSVGRK